LNPISSPGTNPTAAAIGSPDAATLDGCAANCVAVLLSAWTTCPDAFWVTDDDGKNEPIYPDGLFFTLEVIYLRRRAMKTEKLMRFPI
jgi:hypothetical protein